MAHHKQRGVRKKCVDRIALDAQLPPRVLTNRNTDTGVLGVLVVDDNADSAEVMAELLRVLGHEAEVAVHPHDALELAGRSSFDLALVDLSLPDMDGYELGSRLKERIPGISVAIVSGYAQDDDRRRTAQLGFEAHLAKPVEVASIAELVARTPSIGR